MKNCKVSVIILIIKENILINFWFIFKILILLEYVCFVKKWVDIKKLIIR